jgi:hypothetical protein
VHGLGQRLHPEVLRRRPVRPHRCKIFMLTNLWCLMYLSDKYLKYKIFATISTEEIYFIFFNWQSFCSWDAVLLKLNKQEIFYLYFENYLMLTVSHCLSLIMEIHKLLL